jgi:hypothetical protein
MAAPCAAARAGATYNVQDPHANAVFVGAHRNRVGCVQLCVGPNAVRHAPPHSKNGGGEPRGGHLAHHGVAVLCHPVVADAVHRHARGPVKAGGCARAVEPRVVGVAPLHAREGGDEAQRRHGAHHAVVHVRDDDAARRAARVRHGAARGVVERRVCAQPVRAARGARARERDGDAASFGDRRLRGRGRGGGRPGRRRRGELDAVGEAPAHVRAPRLFGKVPPGEALEAVLQRRGESGWAGGGGGGGGWAGVESLCVARAFRAAGRKAAYKHKGWAGSSQTVKIAQPGSSQHFCAHTEVSPVLKTLPPHAGISHPAAEPPGQP